MVGPRSPSEWEIERDSRLQELGYPALSHDLAASLLNALDQWEVGSGGELPPAERDWRIAEALHLLTWLRPQSHSPLCLLFDEERLKANALPLVDRRRT